MYSYRSAFLRHLVCVIAFTFSTHFCSAQVGQVGTSSSVNSVQALPNVTCPRCIIPPPPPPPHPTVTGPKIYLFSFAASAGNETPVSVLHDDGTGAVQVDTYGNGYVQATTAGNFNISGLYASYCPTTTSPIYMVALGGSLGYGTNAYFTEVSAFPVACSQLPNVSSIFIDEATTVAAAYAFAGLNFGSPDTQFSAPNFTESELGARFAYANSLVNGLTGQVNSLTPDNGIVPSSEINSLADLLATCTHSSGAPCATLFSDISTPNITDTFEALINIAINPTYNVGTLYALSATATEYSPALASTPANFSIVISFPSPLVTQTALNFTTSQVVGEQIALLSVSNQDDTPPTGTVACVSAGQPAGSPSTLDPSGKVSISILSLPVGQDFVTCGYSGDANNAPSFISATLNVLQVHPDSTWLQQQLLTYGDIETIIGNNGPGYAGDNAVATSGQVNLPESLAIDPVGNIFFADVNNYRIRKIAAQTGIITTIAGSGIHGAPLTGVSGPAIDAHLGYVGGVALDPSGNVYFSDWQNSCVLKVDHQTGILSVVAGQCDVPDNNNGSLPDPGSPNGDGGPATSAIVEPYSIVFDSAGNLYIEDPIFCKIRKVTASSGIISSIAGDGTCGYDGDNKLATSAALNEPQGLAIDGFGNLYIGDTDNNRVRMITASSGIITTLAGNGNADSTGDGGPALVSTLHWPRGLAVDSVGSNLYVADSGNNRVRLISGGNLLTASIAAYAGNGNPTESGDGGPAVSAALNNPWGVALDTVGNLVITDSVGARLRAVSGALSTTTFNPLYKVVSILYSPPGNQSSQSYGTATTKGTTTTVSSSFSDNKSGTFSVGIPGILSVSGTIGHTNTSTDMSAYTETFTNTTTMASTANNNATYNPTASDSVNHHLDTFEIWLNPLVTVYSNGTTPVNYTVAPQLVTINGQPSPLSTIVGVPAIAMEASSGGVTSLNPTGATGVTTVPASDLRPIAVPQTSGNNAYMPGLAAICSNKTLYSQQLAADLANPANPPLVCTQTNQCGCTPADFANILQMNPLLNYDAATNTAHPYSGSDSPLIVDSLADSSGPGSGPVVCGQNAVPQGSKCRYVVIPNPGSSSNASDPAVPAVFSLAGAQSPTFTINDSTTTAVTLGGSTGTNVSISAGGGPVLANLKVQYQWSWTDSESVGNSFGTSNSMSVTLKTNNATCNEDVSIFEDTLFHTFAFQIPSGSGSDCKQ